MYWTQPRVFTATLPRGAHVGTEEFGCGAGGRLGVGSEAMSDPAATIERYKEAAKDEVTAGYAKEVSGCAQSSTFCQECLGSFVSSSVCARQPAISSLISHLCVQLFGTIIGYSLAGSRKALMHQYDKEAQHAYMTQAYDVALDRFCHFLALVETDPSTTMVSEMRATLTANIGACLYGMDEPDVALSYFERALDEVCTRTSGRRTTVLGERGRGRVWTEGGARVVEVSQS